MGINHLLTSWDIQVLEIFVASYQFFFGWSHGLGPGTVGGGEMRFCGSSQKPDQINIQTLLQTPQPPTTLLNADTSSFHALPKASWILSVRMRWKLFSGPIKNESTPQDSFGLKGTGMICCHTLRFPEKMDCFWTR